MNKFIIQDKGNGVYIEHTEYPVCKIAVYTLEAESCWQGGFGDVFDFFIYRGKDPVLYQFIISDYHDIEGADDINEKDLQEYKKMLLQAWKWFLQRYLLGKEALHQEPSHFGLNKYDDTDQANEFSIETVDGVTYVMHRVAPIFRVKLKRTADALGIIDDVEFMEEPDPAELASLLRKVGDWLAQTKFDEN